MLNGLDPGQRMKAYQKLKAFLDTESARVNRELEELLKVLSV